MTNTNLQMSSFGTVAEPKLAGTVQNDVFRWCPLMDLIAVCSAEGEAIWVYRLNGQRVWSANTKKKCKATQMTWRYDGKLLGVVYEDGSLQVLNGSNGKLVHGEDIKGATAITWAQDVSERKSCDEGQLLSNNLFGIDVMKSLPKLPSLSGSNFHAFSQVSLDDTAETTDMLITGSLRGEIELNLYGVFSIGAIKISEHKVQDVLAVRGLNNLLVIVGDESAQSIVKVDVGFIRKFGLTYLPEVSLTPAKIYALIDYVDEAVKLLHKEIGVLQNQAKRSLVGLSEDSELVKSYLYDTLLTGNPPQQVQTWMREITDRGLKKWSKTAIASYDTIKKVIFENLIPGCERLVILLSRLRGLANWKERGEPLGLMADKFETAIGQVSDVIKQSQKLLLESGQEAFYFKTFSTWLEVVYEEVPDAPPASNKPTNEDPTSLKTVDAAKYITKYLNGGVLGKFDLTSGISGLRESCHTAFDQSKSAMHKQVQIAKSVTLSPSSLKIQQYYDPQMDYWYVLMYQLEATEFELVRFKVNGAENIVEAVIIDMNEEQKILQMEFVDSESIMIISDNKSLFSMSYNTLPYNLLSLENNSEPLYSLVQQNVQKRKLVVEKSREFGPEFTPAGFTVNGLPNRRIGFLLANDNRRTIFFDLDEDEDEGEDDEMI